MSGVSNEKVFDRAVDLIIHADQMLQSWTTRYITIEGGLAFAGAALIKWRIDTPALQTSSYAFSFVVAEVLLVALAIVSAWLITKMIGYELEWQKNYVSTTKRAEGDTPILVPFEVRPGAGRTLSLFQWTSLLLTVMWLGFLAVILFLPMNP